jgi:NTP pyrophosphatase (non-canonical NTP hydrolase)
MENNKVDGTMINRGVVMEIIKNEDWREIRKYLREIRRDLRRGFERLNECLSCPANVVFCGEVARLVESYERALLAVLMLRCFLNEALGIAEDERVKQELGEVLKVTNDLIAFLNEKHDLVHQLAGKCGLYWGESP